MSYVLNSVSIRAPHRMNVGNSTQFAQVRTLDGSINRDFFGSNKRVWKLEYNNTKKADFDTINAIYLAYLADNTAKTWEITETNYAVSETNVHIDIQERGFSYSGTDYLSDFTVTLIEA